MKKLYELIFKKWNEKILRKKKGILQNIKAGKPTVLTVG